MIYIGLNLAKFATFCALGAYAQNLKRIAVNGSTLRVDGFLFWLYNTLTEKEKCMRVQSPGPLYEVQCTEYERGYGQRDMGKEYFTTEQEAKEFCEQYASGDSECFFRASYRKIA